MTQNFSEGALRNCYWLPQTGEEHDVHGTMGGRLRDLFFLQWEIECVMKLQQYVVLLQYSEHVRMKALPGNAACQHSQGMQYLKTKHIRELFEDLRCELGPPVVAHSNLNVLE
ncbi:hypothetical protein pdam_00017643 [Pocillopora damicornis]|uniref:Uncharacterized protein n=1 Tax=Pocillopora damicornis TaxID=46731 RepID=A0A3M6U756_POCDA|nr:hypothetical protein pdam_00017643 [Pocillopora damicornis]